MSLVPKSFKPQASSPKLPGEPERRVRSGREQCDQRTQDKEAYEVTGGQQ